jgi:hypothetical protein
MRRIIALVAVLAFLSIVVTPVAAAPARTLTYAVDCGSDGFFEVQAKGTPGFPSGFAPPVLLLGGTFTVDEGGEAFGWVQVPPRGLAPKLSTCTISGPTEDVGFTLTVDPAYVFIVRP